MPLVYIVEKLLNFVTLARDKEILVGEDVDKTCVMEDLNLLINFAQKKMMRVFFGSELRLRTILL